MFLGGGWYPNSNQFKGYIADFAIFDRVLTADEINRVFESKDGLKPELTSEEKYSMSLVPGSVAVAFDEDRSDNEVSYKLKIAEDSKDKLVALTILDHTTCKVPFANTDIISAALSSGDFTKNADDRYLDIPIDIDVNTTMFESPDSPDDYFTTNVNGENNARLKFCVMTELGSSTVVSKDGKVENSSISYNKVKFDITINMETGFATDLKIQEENASTASKNVNIEYDCKLSQCDGFDLCLSCIIVVGKNVTILFF